MTWRIMYHMAFDAVVILDVFAKKTAATPNAVMTACRQRLAEFQQAVRTKKKGGSHAKR